LVDDRHEIPAFERGGVKDCVCEGQVHRLLKVNGDRGPRRWRERWLRVLDGVLGQAWRVEAGDRGLGEPGSLAEAQGGLRLDGDGARRADLLAEQAGLALEVERGILASLLDELDQTAAALRQDTLLIGVEAGDLGAGDVAQRQPQPLQDSTHVPLLCNY